MLELFMINLKAVEYQRLQVPEVKTITKTCYILLPYKK